MLSDNKFVAFNEIADKLCEVILGRSPEDPSNKSSIGTIGTPLPSMTDLNMTETDYHDKRILEENIRRYLARIDIEVERVDVNENFDGPSSSKYIN